MYRALFAILAAVCCLTHTGCGLSDSAARRECAQHQSALWDAAGTYCLDERVIPEGSISPNSLAKYFKGGLPHCPLGEENYSSFRLFEGPRCPHESARHSRPPPPRKIERIKAITKR